MKTPFRSKKTEGSVKHDSSTKSKKKNKKNPETIAGNGTVEQGIAAKFGRYGIWVAALLVALLSFVGVGLGAVAVLSNPANSFAQELKKQDRQTVESDQAAAYAQGYLMSYLSATKDDYQSLAGYIGEDAASKNTQKVSQALEVRNPVLASVEKTNYGYYSTKIQVEVKKTEKKEVKGKKEKEEVTTWETQWFKVVVSNDGDGKFSPVGFPSSTNAPSTESKTTKYPYTVSNSAVTSATGDFGKAYLAQTGDVNRYISPDAEITAISPAPYKDAALVSVTSLENMDGAVPADGTKAYVLAEYEVTDFNDNVRKETYPLELTSRGGRWEISTIERSPHTF